MRDEDDDVFSVAFADHKRLVAERFRRIWQLVEEVMNRHTSVAKPNLDAILEADRWERATAVGALKG